MKALTIWQPAATLFVAGGKEDESREWRPPPEFHGPLAIHSGHRPIDSSDARTLSQEIQVAAALVKAHTRWKRTCPLGAILAVIETIRVWQVSLKEPVHATNPGAVRGTDGVVYPLTETNWKAANHSAGRFEWRRGKVHLLKEPIDCSGGKGLWDLPKEIEARVREQVRLS